MNTRITAEKALKCFKTLRIKSHLKRDADLEQVEKIITELVEQTEGNVDAILSQKVKDIEDKMTRNALYRMFIAYKFNVAAHYDGSSDYIENQRKNSFIIRYPDSSVMVSFEGEILVPRGKAKLYCVGEWAVCAQDTLTGMIGLYDYRGKVICPCICQGAYTAVFSNEIGYVTYNHLKVDLMITTIENAEDLKQLESEFAGSCNRAYFKSETYNGAIVFSHWTYDNDNDDDFIEVEPGVTVSRDWAAQRGYDVNKPAIDKNEVFRTLIEQVSKYCEPL